MGNPILVTGDLAIFDPAFGPATITVRPGDMKGSGKAKVLGKPVCVEGDEKKVMVSGCPYTTATHTIPGSGSLFIQALVPPQKSMKTKSGTKPALIVSGKFIAKFTVMVPAQQPSTPSPIPDTMVQYVGQGEFQSTQTKSKLGA